VSGHALRAAADTTADPDAFEVRLALDDAVAEGVVRVDCPVEQLGVEAA
jgi:hypothetical protein